MFRFVFFVTILSLGAFANVRKEELCPHSKKHYRATIRHIESGGIGYENGYTTLEAFFSSDPNQWKITPFLDVRGHVFDNGKWAANAGIGLRALWGNRAYGINTYYDYRNPGRFHSNQIGLGIETLGQLFDFRINGYLPVGAKTSASYNFSFGSFSGHSMLVSQKIQSAMKGADAEFGFHFGKSKAFDFYAAAGPYYFIGKSAPATWGGKARISGTFKDILTLEISDSYDRTFRNKVQGQIGLNFFFGPKSKVKKEGRSCKLANALNDRMLQPVGRQEIIVIDNARKNTVAIDPATGLPYFFVFVDNTSSSNGTYESPYHSLTQAQDNSSPNNIIYVFPGDGTTTGMDSGISLQVNQKFWGSGVSHLIQTSVGVISIPAQSNASPTITNTNIDTDGNAIVLASNNVVSGFTITSALFDAIYGVDLQSLEVSSCTIENTTRYAIETTSASDASISVTSNQFLNNMNGISLTLNGTSTVVCSDNTFKGQISVSSIPITVLASGNVFTAHIKNNVLDGNRTGSILFSQNNVISSDINVLNNTITNNRAGFEASLGSSVVISSEGTTDHCSIVLKGNMFSGNELSALYMHTDSGTGITTLEITASGNAISNNGGAGLVLATPVNTLTFLATDNIITETQDNGIGIIASGLTSLGNITINNNTITDIGNKSNGVAINQDFSTLNLALLNNEISRCQGTGILSYAPTGIDSLTLNVSGNTISDCENLLSANAAAGLDIEQYTNLLGSITSNTLSNNAILGVIIGSTLTSPTTCLTLTGNNSNTDYLLTNPVDGLFNLSPCNADSVNVGMIGTSGAITSVQSCPDATPCPP